MSRLNKSYLQQLVEQKKTNKPKLQKGDKLPLFVKDVKTPTTANKLDPNWVKGFNEYMNYLTQQEVARQSRPEGAKQISEVEIKAKKTPWNKFKDFVNPKGGYLDQFRERLVDATGGENWYKTPNSVFNAFTGTITAPLSAPQLGTVYALTGKVQTPAEAMNIQNPVGAFVTDALLDPLLLGPKALNSTLNVGKTGANALVNSIEKQIYKNPKLGVALTQRRFPKSLENITLNPGVQFGDVQPIGEYITTVKPSKNAISEFEFFKRLGEGEKSLNQSLQKRIEDLESGEGFKRLVNQEKEYLIAEGKSPMIASLQAESYAKARLEELKNLKNINKEAKNYSRENFLTGTDNKFVGNKYLYNNAFYEEGYMGSMSEMAKNAGMNLQKNIQDYMVPDPGSIGVGYNFIKNKPIEMHEIAHALQRGRTLPIDKELKAIKPKENLTSTNQKAYDYFMKGSEGQESSAFANELREAMFQKGLIKDYYSPISQQQVESAYKYFKANPIGVYDKKSGEFLSNTRLFDFMAPTKQNSKLLTSVLNKLPALAPVGVGGLGVGLSLKDQKPKGTYQMGGMSIPGVNGSVVSSYQATQYKKYKSKKK